MYIKTDKFPYINIGSIREKIIVSLTTIKPYSGNIPILMLLPPEYIDIRKYMLKEILEIRIERSKG